MHFHQFRVCVVRARISTSHTGLTEALRPRLHRYCFVLHSRLLLFTVVSTGAALPAPSELDTFIPPPHYFSA